MQKTAPTTFSLRAFFAFTTLIAVLCAVGAVVQAVVILAVMALHRGLLFFGRQLACRYPQDKNSLIRSTIADRSTLSFCAMPPPVVLISGGYLLIFFIWHAFLILKLQFYAIPQEWFRPILPGVSLYVVHTAILVALNLFAIVSFLAECYGTGRVRRHNSLMTAIVSIILLIALLAAPIWPDSK